jgi:RNA polymerase sigma factor (sigma-70 family)
VEPALQSVHTGEEQLEALARRYEHRVSFFANKVQRSFMLGSRWHDDLISAGYWGLFKALANRRPEAHERELSAYVSRRIHGAVIDAARSCINQILVREVSLASDGEDASRQEPGADSGGSFASLREGQDPEQEAVRSWKRDAVREALARLDPECRRILRAYMDGASVAEIAEEEGVATGTMQVRFGKLTRQVRARAPELRRILLDSEAI